MNLKNYNYCNISCKLLEKKNFYQKSLFNIIDKEKISGKNKIYIGIFKNKYSLISAIVSFSKYSYIIS